MSNKKRAVLAVAAITAMIPAVAALGPAAVGAAGHQHAKSALSHLASHDARAVLARRAKAEVVVSGLDNPRQLAWDRNGGLLVAEAGHGSYGKPGSCFKGPEGTNCVGRSGKVSLIKHPARATNRKPNRIASGFLSGAAPDGTGATGSDGVSQSASGKTYVQETWFPPSLLRSAGISRHQNGKLLGLSKAVVANISRFEFKQNPDGEVNPPRTDPYAVLTVHHRTLVADAAGNDILRVRHGHVAVWALLPGNTKKVDPVPTSLAKGPHGSIYVGTLYSLVPHKARVLQYSRTGRLMHSWYGFTSITGLTAGPKGHVFVSELFAGCPPNAQPPQCIAGRVVNLAHDGSRSKTAVPYPAGIAWRNGQLYVSAFSIAPAKGALGNPAFSGQVWRLR
jgi:hypothetical protein